MKEMVPIRDMIVGLAHIIGYAGSMADRAPREVYAFISDFYTHVLPIAEQYGGRLVKTFGDGAMIIWDPADATKALEAAGRMRESFELLREHLGDNADMRLAVSLARGPLIAAEMGPPSIRGFDVIGEAANQAARQLRRGEVVISREVAEAAGGADEEDVVLVGERRGEPSVVLTKAGTYSAGERRSQAEKVTTRPLGSTWQRRRK